MGFFDFLNSKEELQRKAQIEKIQKEIFPGGKEQINSEVRTLRELTEYNYSFEDVYKTYIHSSVIYHISQNNSKDNIVKGILVNSESVFTKNDAIKLYRFINAKNNLSNNFNDKSHCSKIFMIALGGIVELKKYRGLTNLGKFEVLIYNSIIVLTEFERKFPNKYEDTVDELFEKLLEKAKSYNIPKSRDELQKFVNERFIIFTNELNKINSQNEFFIPIKSYNAFYTKPFSDDLDENNNVIEIIEYYKYLLEMIRWVTIQSEKV